MYCRKCGKELNNESKWCRFCGQAAGSQASQPAPPLTAPQFAYQPQRQPTQQLPLVAVNPKKVNSKKSLGIIIAIVAFVAVAALAYSTNMFNGLRPIGNSNGTDTSQNPAQQLLSPSGGNSVDNNSNDWDIVGKWKYNYTYTVEGNPRTIIDFNLDIRSFDGFTIKGSYTYNVQDKPLMGSWNYSTDEESDEIYVEFDYQYISNLHASNYGHIYDCFVELYDSTLNSSIIQPCFIIDKDEGILILTGHEQWAPLRPVTKAK